MRLLGFKKICRDDNTDLVKKELVVDLGSLLINYVGICCRHRCEQYNYLLTHLIGDEFLREGT